MNVDIEIRHAVNCHVRDSSLTVNSYKDIIQKNRRIVKFFRKAQTAGDPGRLVLICGKVPLLRKQCAAEPLEIRRHVIQIRFA